MAGGDYSLRRGTRWEGVTARRPCLHPVVSAAAAKNADFSVLRSGGVGEEETREARRHDRVVEGALSFRKSFPARLGLPRLPGGGGGKVFLLQSPAIVLGPLLPLAAPAAGGRGTPFFAW